MRSPGLPQQARNAIPGTRTVLCGVGVSEQFFYHGMLAERRLERVTLAQFAQHVPHIPRAQSVGSARDSASVDVCVCK